MKARVLAVVGWVAVVSFAGLGAHAAESDGPNVSVSVNADVDEVEPGDTVVYHVVVRNQDSEDVDLTIDLTAPDQSRAITASEDGALAGPTVSWPMTLAAGEELRVETALATGEIKDGVRGYPVRACADTGDDVPLTCSTEIIQVAGQPDVRTGLFEEEDGRGWLTALGAVAVFGAGFYAIRRRLRTRAARPAPHLDA
jgi:hypothetical protein